MNEVILWHVAAVGEPANVQRCYYGKPLWWVAMKMSQPYNVKIKGDFGHCLVNEIYQMIDEKLSSQLEICQSSISHI